MRAEVARWRRGRQVRAEVARNAEVAEVRLRAEVAELDRRLSPRVAARTALGRVRLVVVEAAVVASERSPAPLALHHVADPDDVPAATATELLTLHGLRQSLET